MAEKEGSHEERLRELRERLYSRGAPPPTHTRNELMREIHPVSGEWHIEEAPVPVLRQEVIEPSFEMTPMKKRHHTSYRVKMIVGGLIFFLVALALSGSFLLFGKNTISGNNIVLETKGPFAVGGGQELDIQATIANQNKVPIDSATLIIEYPGGTQSVDEPGKELFRERKQLNSIKQGEVVNVPLRAKVFGEENEEKTVLVSIEYSVQGSNAKFFKNATPLRFKISSSPVVLFVENVTKVSSGQEVDWKIDVTSNSPSEISDVLLKAEYPAGFDYTDADPAPVAGRDTWSIPNLKPGEKKTITIKGLLAGKQNEDKVFNFSVGVPNERDKFSLASVFTTQKEEIKIEQPFLDLAISVNNKHGQDVVLVPGASAQVSVAFTNTLSATLYDNKIIADLSGTGLDKSQISASAGYYDSVKNTISWDAQSMPSLKSLAPGQTSTVAFSITPGTKGGATQTPQIELTINAEGNRISESNVSQKLTGTATQKIKVESVAKLSSSVLYSTGAFANTGPLPPRAEEATTYNVLLYVKNGTNAITGGVVTATLPLYVSWLDHATTPEVFAFNTQTREVSWKVGDLAANEEREAEFQVSLTPSVSQVGGEVTLVNEQNFKATDRFTESTIHSQVGAVTNKLSADPDHERDDARVAPKQ